MAKTRPDCEDKEICGWLNPLGYPQWTSGHDQICLLVMSGRPSEAREAMHSLPVSQNALQKLLRSTSILGASQKLLRDLLRLMECVRNLYAPQKASQILLRGTYNFSANQKCLREASRRPSEACRKRTNLHMLQNFSQRSLRGSSCFLAIRKFLSESFGRPSEHLQMCPKGTSSHIQGSSEGPSLDFSIHRGLGTDPQWVLIKGTDHQTAASHFLLFIFSTRSSEADKRNIRGGSGLLTEYARRMQKADLLFTIVSSFYVLKCHMSI